MKILFIACYSPLINNSASIETLQYLNNLVEEGNEIHLLTVDFPKNSIYYDEYIFSMLSKEIKVHIVSGGKVFEKVMPKKSSKIVVNNKITLKGKILRKVKALIAIPDMYYNWAKKASKYGIRLMKKEKFDVMFSMHEPPSSHICAYKIKNKYKDLEWVTYFSDPWLKDSTRENNFIIRKKIEESFERKIITSADRFIFVTEENRLDYVKSYKLPLNKTFVITRGYDGKLYNEIKLIDKPSLIKDDKINIVYAGEIFSKLRDINPFINALSEIKEKDLEFYNKLNILFFGNIDDNEAKNKLSNLENVEVSSRIPFKEALRYMVNADILLLFGNKNSKQIPAKIYDYFGCNGKILVILGDDKDPIINLVKDIEKCNLTNNDKDEIENNIRSIVKDLENKNQYKELVEFESKNISRKLNSIIKGE